VVGALGHAAVVFNLVARGRGHAVTCNRLFRLALKLGRLRLVSQSYIGKRPISKGIGAAIRKFVVRAFAPSCSSTLKVRVRVSARVSRLAVRTAAMYRLKPERIADYLPKCSNTIRRRLGCIAE